jgi:surface polysaccharide O-acyltransferase-like enzyme
MCPFGRDPGGHFFHGAKSGSGREMFSYFNKIRVILMIILGQGEKSMLTKKTDHGEKKKYVYLEAMRVVAIFFVIFNHTGNNGFFLFATRQVGGLAFWIYMFISIFCKFAVPLFFAISGALMLGRDDGSLKDLWSKRIMKMAFLLLIYSFIYYLRSIYVKSEPFSWHEFLKKMYTSQTAGHLWYLYAYIAYLACLPFLKSLVRTLEIKYYYYMIAMAVFFNGFLPIMEYLFWQGNHTLNENLKISWLVSNIVLYPCIGYFMQNKLDVVQMKRKILMLWLFNVAAILVCCYMTYYKGVVTGEFSEATSQTFFKCFAMINCMTIFVTIKYFFIKIRLPQWIEHLITSLGKCTFGIYLLHMLIMKSSFIKQILNKMIACGAPSLLAVLVQCFIVMLICYIITLILLKIPVLKRLVGGKTCH